MNRTWVLCFLVAAIGQPALAQWQKKTACDDRGYPVQKGHSCQQKGNGEQESAPEPEKGAFVAPPRNGTTVGESSGVGVEGPSLTFPELTLKLPNLQFPCLNRFRKGPRMKIDAAEAAFVEDVPRAEFSEEASQEERAPDNGNGEQERGGEPERGPAQKGKYSPQQACPNQNCPTYSDGAPPAPDFARWQQTQAENTALMRRIQELESICHQLESRLPQAPAPTPAAHSQSSYQPVVRPARQPIDPQAAQIAALQQQLAAMQNAVDQLRQTQTHSQVQAQAAYDRPREQVAVYESGFSRNSPAAAYAPISPKTPTPEYRRLPTPQPVLVQPRLQRLPSVGSR